MKYFHRVSTKINGASTFLFNVSVQKYKFIFSTQKMFYMQTQKRLIAFLSARIKNTWKMRFCNFFLNETVVNRFHNIHWLLNFVLIFRHSQRNCTLSEWKYVILSKLKIEMDPFWLQQNAILTYYCNSNWSVLIGCLKL